MESKITEKTEKEDDGFDGMFDDAPSSSSKTSKDIPVKEEGKDLDIKLEKEIIYPILMGSEKFPEDYKTLYDRIIMQYKLLPQINYDHIYKEIASQSVKSCPTPSLSDLNAELEKVQAAKDRMCEIFIDVLKCHTFKKRAVDIIRDSWLKFAGGKAEGKNESIRKGESVYIASDFEQDLAQVEALIQACKHIIKNLDSLTENLSRRITIIQLQVKVQDIGRGMSPDFTDKRAISELSLSEIAEEVGIDSNKNTEKDQSDVVV